jgi:hypothetical protein
MGTWLELYEGVWGIEHEMLSVVVYRTRQTCWFFEIWVNVSKQQWHHPVIGERPKIQIFREFLNYCGKDDATAKKCALRRADTFLNHLSNSIFEIQKSELQIKAEAALKEMEL